MSSPTSHFGYSKLIRKGLRHPSLCHLVFLVVGWLLEFFYIPSPLQLFPLGICPLCVICIPLDPLCHLLSHSYIFFIVYKYLLFASIYLYHLYLLFMYSYCCMQPFVYIMRRVPRNGWIEDKYYCVITNGHLLLYCYSRNYTLHWCHCTHSFSSLLYLLSLRTRVSHSLLQPTPSKALVRLDSNSPSKQKCGFRPTH
jgi:hypothetical protein